MMTRAVSLHKDRIRFLENEIEHIMNTLKNLRNQYQGGPPYETYDVLSELIRVLEEKGVGK